MRYDDPNRPKRGANCEGADGERHSESVVKKGDAPHDGYTTLSARHRMKSGEGSVLGRGVDGKKGVTILEDY